MPGNPTSSSLSAAKTQMSDIPANVVFYEILPRLPDKSIARFKSVSKKWNEIMSSTQFIKTHYRLLSSSSRSFLATNSDAFFTFFDFGDCSNVYFTEFGEFFPETATYLVDSCNGLALLIRSNQQSDDQNLKLPNHLLHFDYHFVVYNPVLGRDSSVLIYQPPQFLVANNNNNNDNMELEAHNYNFGFGYVSSVDDYYIVAINFLNNPEIAVVIHVFSFKTRKWRRKKEYNKRCIRKFEDVWYNKSGILINEVLHWSISNCFPVGEIPIESYEIGMLDLAHIGNPSKDEFRTMQLPRNNFVEAGRETGGSGFSLCCLNGCLCAWGKFDNGMDLDMWMMRKYGVHESWTRLFRLNLNDFCCTGITNFFGFNKCEQAMILTYEHELILGGPCDPYPLVYTHYGFRDKVKAVNYARSLESPLALIFELRE